MFEAEPYAHEAVATTGCAVCLMHMKGEPATMQAEAQYDDIVADSATIRNIMLWDYRPLASTLDQLQVIRL